MTGEVVKFNTGWGFVLFLRSLGGIYGDCDPVFRLNVIESERQIAVCGAKAGGELRVLLCIEVKGANTSVAGIDVGVTVVCCGIY